MELQTLIREFLNRVNNRRITVRCVGDALIDQYYEANVDRVSPEFPTSLIAIQRDAPQLRPGGVANLAYQFKNFDVEIQAVHFYDVDFMAIPNQIQPFGWPIGQDDAGFIPKKKRFFHEGIQITRLDVESPYYGLTPQELVKYQEKVYTNNLELGPADVVVYSDYDKGMFVGDMDLAWIKAAGKAITIVDPKGMPISKWKGCTIFKPNAKEAAVLSGKACWKEQAMYFKRELGCKAVVITYGGKKVVGIWDNDFFEVVPLKSVKVQSVVGAGDCFVAFLALAVGHGFIREEAIRIAYEAGACYVQHSLNRPISAAELIPHKFVQPEDLRRRDFKLVLANGCFDILGPHHVQLLEFAKAQGGKLVVAVNSDDSVRALKGPTRPIVSLQDRMKVLAGLGCVDYVVSFDEERPSLLVDVIRPDKIVKGGDYTPEQVAGSEIIGKENIIIFDTIEGYSTTKIVDRLNFRS